MTRPDRRPRTPATFALAALAALPACADDDPSGLRRLREIPLARRQSLASKLAEFDALPPEEREAIRALDRRIDELPPEDQARYRSVLHRYHLWVGMLTEDQRQALQAAGPERRLELVRRLAGAAPPPPWQRTDRALVLGTTLNPATLFDQAYAIKVWFALTPEQRASVEKLPARRRRANLAELGREHQVENPRPTLMSKLGDTLRDQAAVKPQFLKRLDALKPQEKTQLLRRLAEARFLSDYEPAPVEPRRLERFAEELPGWLLEPLDGLPPDPARERLAILYRLVFPGGEELPDRPADATPHAETKPNAPTTGEPAPPF